MGMRLLERDVPLASLAEIVADARRGDGRLVLVTQDELALVRLRRKNGLTLRPAEVVARDTWRLEVARRSKKRAKAVAAALGGQAQDQRTSRPLSPEPSSAVHGDWA